MNQQSSLHVGFCPHSSIKFALQIDGTDGEKWKGGKKQEEEVRLQL